MSVIGEQRPAGNTALRRQGPTVGADATHRRRDRLVVAKRVFHAVTRRDPGTRLARAPSPELDGPVLSEMGQLQSPLQLLAHRPAEVELHQEADT